MSRPLIGITTSLSGGTQSLDLRYAEAVARAGGVPLILPAVAEVDVVRPLVDRVGGLVVPGGPGIVQGLVGELPEDMPPVEEARWRSDCLAFDLVRAQNKPVLGICYGMQFINARMGGRIYADAQRQAGAGPHAPERNQGREVKHEVELEPGSLLARLAGAEQALVNSFHVQAVAEPGEGLRVSARSRDGLVEGIESGDGRLVGVQFHPERMPGTVWEGLFGYLVEKAAQRG